MKLGRGRPWSRTSLRMRASSSPRVNCGSSWIAVDSRLVARWPLASLDDALDRSVVVELQALGLRERSLEVMGWDVRGEVEQGAVRRSWSGCLGGWWCPGQRGNESGAGGSPGRRLRDAGAVTSGRRRVVGEEVPVHRRADVTEHRARPARHDRRQPAPLARQHRAAHGVDAAVHPRSCPACARRCAARAPMPKAPSCASDTTPHCRAASSASATSGGVRS